MILKHAIDGLAISGVVTAVIGILPTIGIILTVLWLAYRLYDLHLSVINRRLDARIKQKQLEDEG